MIIENNINGIISETAQLIMMSGYQGNFMNWEIWKLSQRALDTVED